MKIIETNRTCTGQWKTERKIIHTLSPRIPQERKELLSKATLAIAERSMALHDATADADQTKAELRSAEEKKDMLENEVKEVGCVEDYIYKLVGVSR